MAGEALPLSTCQSWMKKWPHVLWMKKGPKQVGLGHIYWDEILPSYIGIVIHHEIRIPINQSV